MRIFDIIHSSAGKGLAKQSADGSMAPGHNGPYHDPETPVRNTAHWSLIWLKVYQITGDASFRDAAERALAYLCSDAARPMQASFWCRKNPAKDYANGLVGQAWAMEALVEAASTLQRPDLLRLAETVFLLHPFDSKLKAWRIVHVDGHHGRFDTTFNHQLWFAAAGGLLASHKGMKPDPEVGSRVDAFLSRLSTHLTLYRDGLIRHKSLGFLAAGWRQKCMRYLMAWPNRRQTSYLRMKSVGYHGFNLYALGMLKATFPEHPVWDSRIINRALHYALSVDYKRDLNLSKYGYPYNPPGFEIPFALQAFAMGSPELCAQWIGEQMQRCFDFKSGLMQNNTEDPETAAARFYEVVRINDCDVTVPIQAVCNGY